MLSKLAGYAVIAVVGWWAWHGPIHDWRTVSADEQLETNADNMARCMRGKEYVAGSGGAYTRDPEASCARELNLYRHAGQWYSHASVRPSGNGNGNG